MSNELDSLMMQADLANKEAREASTRTHSHTPGPWVERDCEIQAADGSAICEMLARPEDEPKWGRDHADANSRLICAAPELLEALKRTLSMAIGHAADARGVSPAECGNFQWVKDAQAAINKATKG